MKIAVEGCAHGELEKIYSTLGRLEEIHDFKVDLLICCGDFQSSRNVADLHCMAVPRKYVNICSFYKYYTGEKTAPVLTIFIGGNHEASNYLQELPYGGWVAPNIYYMGYAGVINIAGVRIGGLSGIYKSQDFMKGHHEHPPYSESSKRSVYHIRNLEVFRLKQVADPIDIFLSHDWPTGVTEFGNQPQLLRFKPYFEEDIASGSLGSKPAEELLKTLKPEYWFSAHLHCKFAALIPHEDGKTTKFLALDKCLPKRRFLQMVDITHKTDENIEISYDLEWLTILRLTNHLLSVKNVMNYMPGAGGSERWSFQPSDEEKLVTFEKFEGNLIVPKNFVKTARGYVAGSLVKNARHPLAVVNPQTIEFCEKLLIDDPLQLLLNLCGPSLNSTKVEEGDSVDNSTVISRSDVSLEVTSGSVSSRISLNLPEPVHNLEVPDSEVMETNQAPCLPNSHEDDDEKVAPCVELGQEVGKIAENKFKRRNGVMYENEDKFC